ncbi:hypothetical protein PCYB_002170 [Plasmodium cynomolgi strain B]|uniref:CYIR protein n=1 Tax=Plasmodium cynomolgi (strain B) TaxID=1120755 RepID=K6UNG6_PLACD|nr:hypothetical protein PCYB_002170 [Plasmodium cynomolgi strain B]GAB69468.1 hypothetical protein PCYB_002170 [Plasmodium cynomolgi strain B]
MVSLYHDFLSLWRDSSCCEMDKDKRCTKNVIIEFDKKLLKIKKELYDFSEYYDYVRNKLSSEIHNNKEYCEYTKYIFKLYNKLNEEYKERGLSHRYEKELIFFNDKINKDSMLTLLKSKCNIDDSLLRPFENVETSNLLQQIQEKNATRRTKSSSDIELLKKIKTEKDNILKNSPAYLIYTELDKEFKNANYNITRCNAIDNSREQIKTICKKIVRNLNELRTLENVKNESHRDRCTYLNFWIYRELSKLYINNNDKDKNIFDLPEAAKLLKAGIEINNDLIKEDLNKNLKSQVWTKEPQIIIPSSNEDSSRAQNALHLDIPSIKATAETLTKTEPKLIPSNPAPSPSFPSSVSLTSKVKTTPFNIISYKDLSSYEPCFLFTIANYLNA